MYELLEQQVVPEFYERTHAGIPQAWLTRIRTSMFRLAPQFSSLRMVREYVERIYRPASEAVDRRLENGAKLAAQLQNWHVRLNENWNGIRLGDMHVKTTDQCRRFNVQVYLGELAPDDVLVELYADPLNDCDSATRLVMRRQATIPGAVNVFLFTVDCASTRPADHFTPRVLPFHPDACMPLETPLIFWRH